MHAENCTILQGDALALLKTLPDEHVQCVVTSPPYWGLRDYGVAGQIGLEPTPAEYLARMVAVFEEVRRVLRSDGTAWVNMGDCYAAHIGSTGAQGKTGQRANRRHTQKTLLNRATNLQRTNTASDFPVALAARVPQQGLKPKDLVGMPWRLAFALQAAGWYLRSDIIWHKPNPMPESVTDRPTKSHEYLFLLSKSERYYYDAEAIQEKCSESTHARLAQDVQNKIGSTRAHAGGKSNGNMKAVGRKPCPNPTPVPMYSYDKTTKPRVKNNPSFDAAMAIMPDSRNKRTVWTIPTQAFPEAHFATFPEALVEPCIQAGCPAGGLVLDPFSGAGTTGLVAVKLGRRYLGLELNPAYVAMAERRIKNEVGLLLVG